MSGQNKRKIMVAGNWKEHFNTSQASHFLHRLQDAVPNYQNIEVVLMPNMMVLQPLSVQLDRRKFRLGAQNGYHIDEGTFTGEVSMAMISDIVHYVLVGHSERRKLFHESNDEITKKTQAAVRNGIMPMLCIGETMHERLAGDTFHVLHDQITSGLLHLTGREVSATVIAYEPSWAISDGSDSNTADPEEVKKAFKYIRQQVEHLYGKRVAGKVRILYGASINDHNAKSILSIEGCDGVLVGGASLHHHKFAKIVESAHEVQQEREG